MGAAEGTGLIELYGGLGPTTATPVFCGAKGACGARQVRGSPSVPELLSRDRTIRMGSWSPLVSN